MQAAVKSGREGSRHHDNFFAKISLMDDLTAQHPNILGGAIVLLITTALSVYSMIGRPNENSADNSGVGMTPVLDSPLHDKAQP